MENLNNRKIVILGAGIVGLTSATRLIENFEKVNNQNALDITIISDNFDLDTTSDGAGGLFRPDDRFMGGVPKHLAKEWSTESFRYYDDILFKPEGGKAGVFQCSGYQLFDDDRQDPSYRDFIYQFRHLTKDELNMFPKKFKDGYFSTTIGVEPRIYMKYLTEKLMKKGVRFYKQKLDTLNSFVAQNNYDIIFNCLGLGNISFCNDKKMVPIRGQMIRVTAPWIKHFYFTDDLCYIIPNVNTICLGGTRQKGNFSLELDKDDSKGIFERCKELCPSLENAKIEWEWVGLRPHREPTRVEKQIFSNQSKKNIIVIHNYGHGGNGISLSPGTSLHAIQLLERELNLQNDFKSKL